MKNYLQQLVLLTALVSVNAQANNPSFVILQYHHVSDTTPASTSIKPDRFQEHINYLVDNRFNVIPLADALTALAQNKALPEKSIVITFDDGYKNILTTALPILEAHNLPFTLFVSTSLVGTNDRIYLTWDEIAQLGEAGVQIANHTHTHAHLVRRLIDENEANWQERITDEITTAERLIAEHTGQSHKLLA